ncbi:antibiotic biosynthesis monooxygenase [Yinghuangia sp. ASG 101]|uniref:antibiotic biosynthesis monooxygenase n=1 Tax=Yinghuangia sp. ASG 101 TaxID=2896848 RepID=UPI001E5457D3|nr:antibiotic biosynthesis monooxygenase [Yinghuangia sp. ASG 101]UGQ11778.1 antibiotic biosynthesis monooxygenase [Yinghuangia sp. ASG 101]
MPDTSRPDVGFVATAVFHVPGREQAQQVVELLIRGNQGPIENRGEGFLSATFHISSDGTRVFNYAQWTSEEVYMRDFANHPGKEVMRKELARIEGVEGPFFTAYTPVHTVLP